MRTWWKQSSIHAGRLVVLAILWAGIACEPAAEVKPDPRPGGAGLPGWVEVRDPGAPAPLRRVNSKAFGYRHDYLFSEDWFTHNIPNWVALLQPYRGRPDVRYLEVGIFEGRSLLWMMDRVLTHQSSQATGIDIMIPDTLLSNVELSGSSDRVTLIQGSSQEELRKLPLESYDIVYIDGSHTAADVLADIVLSWGLLRPGGLMILDDYAWKRDPETQAPTTPEELLPLIAIDGFISAYRNFVEVVHKRYQVALRKRAKVCGRGEENCSTLGRYSYDWHQRILYEGEAEIELTGAERGIVEALIRGKRGDGLTLRVSRKLYASQELWALADRLGMALR